MKFYRKFYNVIALDKELFGTTIKLYMVLLALANFDTHELTIYIDTLAKKINRSANTVRRHLSILIRLGLVERITRKSPHNPKMNLANLFVVHDIDAERYANADENSSQKWEGVLPKMGGGTPKNEGQIIQDDFLSKKFLKENTLKRGVKLPKKNNEFSSKNLLEEVPEILRTTAQYWLMKTGKKSLSKYEIEILRELLDKHTPVRIQKEIDTAIERFIRDGKNPAKQNFAYIGKALSSQKSYNPEKKTSTKRKKISQPKTEQQTEAQNLSISVEGAEKIISDYAPSTLEEKKSEPLPVALTELFEKIQTKDKEILENYCSRHVAEVERAKQTKEPERKIELEKMKLEDYLQLKFPEAEEEELHRDYSGHVHEGYNDFPRGHLLEEAFEIDYACAMCQDSKSCHLPEGYSKNTPNRPVVKMPTNKNGEKYLSVDYGERITCKHCHLDKVKADYELEDRIKCSGLATTQTNKTFETFDHKNASPEVIVAKAQAILAAKNRTNLILAGKPGTGKTHLASAIALEAIKNGRKAIFKSLPELLDEICWAHQNCTDAFELMMKYKKVPCLVLDDWGKEKTTDARMDYLFQIIDYRYRNGLQMILTTNALNAEGLKNRWNADKIEPLVSRILENGQWVTICNSENFRLKKVAEPEPQEATVTEELSAPVVEVAEADKTETIPEVRIEDQTQEIYSEKKSGMLPEEEPMRKSWQEISESAEYAAMSEHEKILTQWNYVKESPDYEALSNFDKIAVQIEFSCRLEEAKKNQSERKKETVSSYDYDDGLDDDEDDLKLYGDTGIPK